MEEKVHAVDPFIDMPVSAEPGDVIERALNSVQPSLCAVIHSALLYHREKSLYRLIFVRAGV